MSARLAVARQGAFCHGCGELESEHTEVSYSEDLAKWVCASCYFATTRPEPIEPEQRPLGQTPSLTPRLSGFPRSGTDKTEALASALDIRMPLGEPFPCPLGDDDRHDAVLVEHPNGYWHLACEREPRSLGLAEVRARIAYGRPCLLSSTELARWRERLAYEAGILPARTVPLRLPDRAPASWWRVAASWALLVGLRDPRWGDEPFVFARRFVVAWAGVTDQQARRAVRALEEARAIRHVGWRQTGEHRAKLWRPAVAEAVSR